MNRLLLAALAPLALAAFTACSDNGDDDDLLDPDTTSTTTMTSTATTPDDGSMASGDIPTRDEIAATVMAGSALSEDAAECVADGVLDEVDDGNLEPEDVRDWIDGLDPAGPAQSTADALATSGECAA